MPQSGLVHCTNLHLYNHQTVRVCVVSGVCCWRLTFSGRFAEAETEDVSDVFLYMYHSKQHRYIYSQTAFCSIH